MASIHVGRSNEHIERIEKYLAAVKMLRDYNNEDQDPIFSETVTLDLSTVVSSVSGPKRPHDRVSVTDMKADFNSCLTNKVYTTANTNQEMFIHFTDLILSSNFLRIFLYHPISSYHQMIAYGI